MASVTWRSMRCYGICKNPFRIPRDIPIKGVVCPVCHSDKVGTWSRVPENGFIPKREVVVNG